MNNNLRAVITRSRTAKMATVDDIQKVLSEREGKDLSIINPIPFDGRPDENCYLFIRTFEQYCDYSNIKEEEKLKLFCILLKGLAANWIENLEDGKKKTDNDVKKQFSSHFQSTSTNFLNQQKLESIKHTGHASIETYIEQVIEASNNLGLNDNEKKQALLRGLPPHAKAQIIVDGPDTVMETIQRLLLINQGEKVKKQAKEQEDSTMQLATLSTAVANIEKLMTSQPAQQQHNRHASTYRDNHHEQHGPPAPVCLARGSKADVIPVVGIAISAETVLLGMVVETLILDRHNLDSMSTTQGTVTITNHHISFHLLEG